MDGMDKMPDSREPLATIVEHASSFDVQHLTFAFLFLFSSSCSFVSS